MGDAHEGKSHFAQCEIAVVEYAMDGVSTR